MTDKHTDAAFQITEGDTVHLEADDAALHVECIDMDTIHSDDRTPAVFTQKMWTLEDRDGDTYRFGRLDGLSPVEGGEDAYPSFIPLVREDAERDAHGAPVDEDTFGYIRTVTETPPLHDADEWCGEGACPVCQGLDHPPEDDAMGTSAPYMTEIDHFREDPRGSER